MKKDEIKLTDFYRIFNGEAPPEFYIELILRSLFVFLLLVFAMKWFGKRVSSQLTRTELAAISTLAAATGLIILAPDRGLIPPIVVVLVILFVQRAIHRISMKHESFEFATKGHLTRIVNEGVMDIHSMKNARISREEVFAQVRSQGMLHIGEVKRLLLEASGDFTLIRTQQPRPGLSVVPDWDTDLVNEQEKTDTDVCMNCGHLEKSHPATCPECGDDKWGKAVK